LSPLYVFVSFMSILKTNLELKLKYGGAAVGGVSVTRWKCRRST
jgi:hypothetical protein